MKKLSILFILLFLPCCVYFHQIKSNADEIIFAKIENNESFLYSSPTDQDKFKLFILPQSYFVKLINQANDDFYYCSYKDIKGYVRKNQVTAMKGTPAQPYVEGLFRVFSLEGTGLYALPTLSATKLSTIPYLTDNLVYYGVIKGQAIPEKTDEWIYCRYSYDQNLYGYVYSVFCDKTPIYTQNTERFEVVDKPFEKEVSPNELSSTAMGFIIAGVALPCLIVIILLIKPALLKEKLTRQKPRLRARRNRDYFEFDDSDLN